MEELDDGHRDLVAPAPYDPAAFPHTLRVLGETFTIQKAHLHPDAGPLLDRYADAFEKVWEHRGLVCDYATGMRYVPPWERAEQIAREEWTAVFGDAFPAVTVPQVTPRSTRRPAATADPHRLPPRPRRTRHRRTAPRLRGRHRSAQGPAIEYLDHRHEHLVDRYAATAGANRRRQRP
ncbi:hypothetical protein [Rhizomonospora bruguierae]|uniref:hypothetical protein n=1 Tax=Rhizomonospora bruguierae TaxID=1581705 RepID=UPI001BCEBC81|nr:hypothetical protein [Micromonospora sp. NBRC 107566]